MEGKEEERRNQERRRGGALFLVGPTLVSQSLTVSFCEFFFSKINIGLFFAEKGTKK